MTVKLYKLNEPLANFQEDLSRAEELLGRPTHVERVKKIKGSNGRTFDFDLQLTFTRSVAISSPKTFHLSSCYPMNSK